MNPAMTRKNIHEGQNWIGGSSPPMEKMLDARL
jgi:hypothetical protein